MIPSPHLWSRNPQTANAGVRSSLVMLVFLALACSASPSDTPEGSAAPTHRSVSIATSGCGYAHHSSGSGFLLSEDQVLTAAHVVGGAETISVSSDGAAPSPASAIAYDPARDLAILHILGTDPNSAPLPLATFETMAAGQSGFIIGAQSQDRIEFEILKRTDIEVNRLWVTGRSPRSGYLLRATTTSGDSGAALFNDRGNLAGLLFAVSTEDNTRSWAIAADEIEAFLNDPTVEGHFVCDQERSKLTATD